jgi:hypothetical protein
MTDRSPGQGGFAGHDGLDARTLGEVAARAASPDYPVWERQVRRAGACSHPVRLAGTIARGGSTVLDTATLPDRVLLKRCGNRRADVCPSCSDEYHDDAWHLLRAGTRGGAKGMGLLAGHPEVFVTLTAPSYGAVHTVQEDKGGLCHPEHEGQFCAHGRPRWCRTRHGENDSRLGQPLCSDCYDYTRHVLFNRWASELWRRFTITFGRHLSRRLGITDIDRRTYLRISFAKVAEYQRRGVIHFHGIIRLDGRKVTVHHYRDDSGRLRRHVIEHTEIVDGPDGPTERPVLCPPVWPVTADDLAAAARTAAAHVTYDAWEAPDRTVTLRFGRQTHVRAINSGIDGEITSEAVAAYIAKYQTKSTGHLGLPARPIHSAGARYLGLSEHLCRIIATCERLARAGIGLERLERWTHMLAFPGHAFTKSRRFSTTFGALRRARADYQRRAAGEHRDPDDQGDEDDTLVINLRYVGRGYTTNGDAYLATSIAAWTREGRALAREAA